MTRAERPTKATPVSKKESCFRRGEGESENEGEGEDEGGCGGCRGGARWVLLILGLVAMELWGGEGSGVEGNWLCSGGTEGEEGLLEKNLWRKDILLQKAERWEGGGA